MHSCILARDLDMARSLRSGPCPSTSLRGADTAPSLPPLPPFLRRLYAQKDGIVRFSPNKKIVSVEAVAAPAAAEPELADA